ncbi:unnamed protein product [Rhizophagus irregularis]|uniref:Uncharacterized protein n=1 Tax=Rhizophagus irregularis TaxID=588596 RepID=A0A916E2W1_9GLOM|nr:unnamed protein product [Rhizophagus irregularis]CAB5185471.1 unnamed protein product [Rhizophagus irregularis]CAB5354053.1 unnamed protein product [Rhizophagus irregularis]CAB5393014.1 unnamed protein product [Rhizophagus irregularis]
MVERSLSKPIGPVVREKSVEFCGIQEKCFLQLKQKENGYFRASIICTHKLRSALGKLRNWLLTTTFLEASKPFNKISSLCRNELFYSNFNVFFD